MTEEEKVKIIFAEDDEGLAKLIRFKLEKEQFEVTHFANGEGVTQAILDGQPNAVVLDIMMPVKDGITILRELRADPFTKDIPIIMLSAKTQEKDVVKALEFGATDYLTKPFSPSELIARIRRVTKK